ncbi:methionine--tRNA ligase [Bacillus sp. 1P06AnD]|uniref:methionine--tRNA ligase n=1 Tax=Bacillus sp. 1P06AnD TaxID=3132208 RepID=UPI0039A38F03
MPVFIGGAWPYANGSLHLGHIASLLPGDVLARYYRLKGEDVLYVSGSDCNGTPISIRARQEKISVKTIADRYHNEFLDSFDQLGFSYDIFTRTDSEHHHQTVQEVFMALMENGHIYPKMIKQAYCCTCSQFLPDRYVEGLCPHCKQSARGDQCDYCGHILETADLVAASCKLCGSEPSFRETEHLYFSLSEFQERLEKRVEQGSHSGNWRMNAVNLSRRYLLEGLKDRAVSRDLPLGVSVPVKGYEDKKIYVWIEAVSGYYSASRKWAEKKGTSAEAFWNSGCRTYYVHGKDNIPFHTLIWPAIMMGACMDALPAYILSSEYLTVEKQKLSTSRNWAVWVPEMLERYDPDSIRYYLIMNGPENRDADFSWREFIYSHNSELLGAFGNFVNRTLKFIERSFQGNIPHGTADTLVKEKLQSLYDSAGRQIEGGQFKKALEDIFDFIRFANKYFDEREPWKQVKEAPYEGDNTLFNCVLIITNLVQLLSPFIPFACEKTGKMIGMAATDWAYKDVSTDQIKSVSPLFNRLDVNAIAYERQRLMNGSQ